ncbi:ABC transporter permease [Propionivibrio soli]|uniref:ABC transporter permease n=1 Tax=Propionivibrio soli TaxID=2976531 RepID=UPI0021E80677|nr:ABC transporter permease subunit [Propionivibrio soli]
MKSYAIRSSVVKRTFAVLLAAYLLVFLVLPIVKLVIAAITDETGQLIRGPLDVFFNHPLYLESLFNSIVVSAGAALLAAIAAMPIAFVLWRARTRPPLLVELFGFLPLFVPPFMLSLSLQSLLGRGSGLGQWLQSWGDMDPGLWGLPSVAVIEAIHYFPLVLMLLIMSTAAYSEQAHATASVGVDWRRLAIRVFLPLGLPGLGFGMAITFLKTLDDLATPLSLGLTNLLAPQAFFRVSTYGAQDPLSSLMAIAMILISALAWLASVVLVRQGLADWERPLNSPLPRIRGRLGTGGLCLGAIGAFYLVCYSGVILTSIARIWSYTALPESYSFAHYASALESETQAFANTFFYCGFAAVLDVAIGLALAYAIDHAPDRWRRLLTWSIASLLSVPAIALAIAYLQFFQGLRLPLFDEPLDATGFLLPLAFSVRGLPFAIRACHLVLRNVPASYIEAAQFSGRSRWTVARRIVLPMMALGLIVAFLICFGVSAVDLSSAMLLVPSETEAPISYSIYLHMQSTTGRGTGSALAVLVIAFVAIAMTGVVALLRARRAAAPPIRRIVFPGTQTH